MPYTVRSDAGTETQWHNVFFGNLIGSNPWSNALFFYKRLNPDSLWIRIMGRSNSNTPGAVRFMFDTVYRDGIVFAVRYNPNWRDINAERAESKAAFQKVAGGPLGLKKVRSVQVSVRDLERRAELWGRLLQPHEREMPRHSFLRKASRTES